MTLPIRVLLASTVHQRDTYQIPIAERTILPETKIQYSHRLVGLSTKESLLPKSAKPTQASTLSTLVIGCLISKFLARRKRCCHSASYCRSSLFAQLFVILDFKLYEFQLGFKSTFRRICSRSIYVAQNSSSGSRQRTVRPLSQNLIIFLTSSEFECRNLCFYILTAKSC